MTYSCDILMAQQTLPNADFKSEFTLVCFPSLHLGGFF